MIKKVDHPSRKAGRPIRLDKGAIKRFAKYLSGRILRDLSKRPHDEPAERAKRDVSFNTMIKQSIAKSKSWERIEPYLSRQNKKKIMSAVYREAEDWRDDTDYS